MTSRGADLCIVDQHGSASYAEVADESGRWLTRLAASGIRPGEVVSLQSDFTVRSIALLLAILRLPATIALLPVDDPKSRDLLQLSFSSALVRETGQPQPLSDRPASFHPLLAGLRDAGRSGVIIFSSGSTGEPKVVLHDAERLLSKFDQPGKAFSTMGFLLFDHIAGLDNLLYTISNGGTFVVPEARDPFSVASAIQRHRVKVLPATPTFLRLLCLSGALDRYETESVRIVTYGAEMMSPASLALVTRSFPGARVIQKYGTSEFGSPRSLSESRDSLWINFADDVETRIEDGVLWIKSKSAMLGYLNAANPIDEKGWFCTGDRVEQRGEWLRILGRESELINVGGEKVYPHEVEDAILEIDWVEDVVVKGVANALMGQVVAATVQVGEDIDVGLARRAIRTHCRARLAAHKVPVKVALTKDPVVSERSKKPRN